MLHLRLLDGTAAEQQEALGVFGVNFLHTVFYKWQAIAESVESCKGQLLSLVDELGTSRIEVDLMHVDGPDFTLVDNRILALQVRACPTPTRVDLVGSSRGLPHRVLRMRRRKNMRRRWHIVFLSHH
jgi:hypothetical protein